MNERRPQILTAKMHSVDPTTAFEIGTLESHGDTDVGRVRSVNQDAWEEWQDPEHQRHLLFVADGMGGHRGGEVASQIAVEEVGFVFKANADDEPPSLLEEAFLRANRSIFDRAQADSDLRGMGTTGVALLLMGNQKGWVAHVGDSRLYRLRNNDLELLTGDHSVVGELIRRGQITQDEARVHPQRNEILRAIGTRLNLAVDINAVDVQHGDRYLLCTDGLSGMLSDREIQEAMGADPLSNVAPSLIECANQAGGTDNVTLVVAEVPSAEKSESTHRPHRPGPEAAASGSGIRWLVLLALLGGLLFLFLGGSGSESN